MPNIIIADAEKCSGCLTCMLRCAFKFEGMFRLSVSRIKIIRLLDQSNEFDIIFTPECDGCGVCAKYCPYEALTCQKVGRV